MVNRIEWIDALKGFAIFTVVLGHCTGGALASHAFINNKDMILAIHNFIYSFHMPLFFSASGFLFYLTKSYNKYKVKVLDLALMYAFWTIITWLMKYFAGNSINYPVTFQTLLTNIYNPTFIYWYLYALMLMYLFYSITKIKQIDIKALLPLAVISCSSKFLLPNLGIVTLAVYFAYFFALGGYLINSENYKKLNKYILIPCTAITLINIYLYINQIILSSEIQIIKDFILSNAAIIICYYIFTSYKQLKLFNLFGFYSLHIYVTHDFLVAGTRMLFIRHNLENFPLFAIIGLILSLTIPIIMGKLCSKNALLNFPFAPLNTLKTLFPSK